MQLLIDKRDYAYNYRCILRYLSILSKKSMRKLLNALQVSKQAEQNIANKGSNAITRHKLNSTNSHEETSLLMLFQEVKHKCGQCSGVFLRDGIVERGPQPAHRAVALQRHQSPLRRLF